MQMYRRRAAWSSTTCRSARFDKRRRAAQQERLSPGDLMRQFGLTYWDVSLN